MPDHRLATVTPIAEPDASEAVAAVYADIKATKAIDFVPNIWRVLATNPTHLEQMWTRLKGIMHPESVGRTSKLDPVTREAIALAVSATNGCAYCVNSHTAALQRLGLDAEAIGEVLAVTALFNSTNCAGGRIPDRARCVASSGLSEHTSWRETSRFERPRINAAPGGRNGENCRAVTHTAGG